MTDYLLTFLIFCPIVAACILLMLPRHQDLLIRLVALAGGGLTLPPAIWLCLHYNRALGGFQFEQRAEWIPSLGVSYHVAIDGVSAALLLLTALLITGGVFATWTLKNRTKEFLALLLLLVGGVFGVFASRDLFLFFLFYEIAVLPMYLLIGVWGTSTAERTKEYSAMKLTLMLMAGSAFILVAILAFYFTSPIHSFDLDDLRRAGFDVGFQRWVFGAVYVGFGVLAGIWPLHTWSPDGHASAPTAVSMLHAGVLMKLGAYGVLRLGVELLPDGAQDWSFLMATIATINILYGAFSALGQTDLKYVIAYSSVSHMGVVMLGLASLNPVGIAGSVMQMISHGIMTGLFFAVVGLVYEKAHTRDIRQMGGFARRMPGITVAVAVGGFASFGLPATSGFIAEFLCFYGMWLKYPTLALLSVGGIVLTALYVLRLVQKLFFGALDGEHYGDLPDARTTEWVAITAMAVLLLAVGLYPKPLVGLIDAGRKPGSAAANSILVQPAAYRIPLPSPSRPQAAGTHPIVNLYKESEYGLLVGASANGRWLEDKKAHDRMKGGEAYRFYSLMKRAGEASGGKPELSEVSGAAWTIKIIRPPKTGDDLIGIGGAWNALPRVPRLQDTKLPVYRAAVAAILKQKGLDRAPVRITRIVRVDLDGDGEEEVLLSASSPRFDRSDEEGAMYHSKAGDYSFVMLRQAVKGKVKTALLGGMFQRRAAENEIPYLFEIGGALDADGDGKMEVFVRSHYYEGGGMSVYRVKAGTATEVLSAMDGA